MKLDPSGREYTKFPVTGLPTSPGDLEVRFDVDALEGTTWHTCVWEGTGPDRTAKLLVAGPDATGNPDGTAVLALGWNLPVTRLVDNPEVIIRQSSGVIEVG